MQKYTNEYGKECYSGACLESPFSPELFTEVIDRGCVDGDRQWALHTNLGSLTVLDRMTGFSWGYRDIETGYRDPSGVFWLASGQCDVRNSGAQTIGQAIEWVKRNANTCNPAVQQ